MADRITFTVEARPRPQGSKTGTRNGRVLEGRTRSQRALFHAWRTRVADEAAVAMHHARRTVPFRGPVSVHTEFRFHRTRSTPTDHWWRTSTPDLDKLQRAVLDALKIGGIYGDDAQVAELTGLKLHSPPDGPDGATITVTALTHTHPAGIAPSRAYHGHWTRGRGAIR